MSLAARKSKSSFKRNDFVNVKWSGDQSPTMKAEIFEREFFDPDEELFIISQIRNGGFGSKEFGIAFSRFTEVAVRDLGGNLSTFDGCAAEQLIENDKVISITWRSILVGAHEGRPLSL